MSSPLVRVALLLLPLFTHGCSSAADTPSIASQSIAFDLQDTLYFSAQDIARSRVDRFAGTFLYVGEPSFVRAQVPDSAVALRFFWRRSFEPHIVVRVVMNPTTCSVHAAALGMPTILYNEPDSLGMQTPRGALPGPMQRNDSLLVPVADCREMLSRFRAAADWDASAKADAISVDGSDWMFELLDAHGHHAFSRFTPDSVNAPGIWRAGIGAIDLARVRLVGERIY